MGDEPVNELMLPTTHMTYESFEHAMCYGIGNMQGDSGLHELVDDV